MNEISIIKPELRGTFPVIINCIKLDTDVRVWLKENKDILNLYLTKYGALLFRGFKLSSLGEFKSSFEILFGDNLEYFNRTSPRKEIQNKIYTSTIHPADQYIHMHTENSYSPVWNQIIGFFCIQPADVGGETPIADERRVIELVDPVVLKKFKKLGVKYVRNTIPGIGLGWQEIYQTDDKFEVEAFLTKNDIAFEWVTDMHLRTEWVMPAYRRHPETGEDMWFNHMYFGHKSLYDTDVLEFLGDENLPFSTYYGDGSLIPDEIIGQFTAAYNRVKIQFKWLVGDMLLLDNMIFSHGRNPFIGDRKILVSMAKPLKS